VKQSVKLMIHYSTKCLVKELFADSSLIVRIPPLPPPICHIFTRWRVAEAYRDFVFGNNDFVSDDFNDFTLFFGVHRLPVVVKVARLRGDFLGWPWCSSRNRQSDRDLQTRCTGCL
jgi:hypothetical protein